MTIQEVTVAKARNTDPQTSHDAADSVTDISDTQAAIMLLLRSTPMCDERLVEQYTYWQPLDGYPRATPQSIRSRRAELVKKGLVEPAGFKEIMSTGRFGQVWQVVK
jgi:hypothetical protein